MYDNETAHISTLHALNIQMTTWTTSARNNHQSQIAVLHVSVSACECEWGLVSGCHVNHSGSQSLSITAACRGNDMQPDFNITWAEWHLTQVCVIVCTLLCVCIILRVIVFSFPPLACFESHRDGRPWPRVCVSLCVCTLILSFLTQPIFLQSLSSLFPVLLHTSAIYRVENPELQIWMEFLLFFFSYSGLVISLYFLFSL